MKVDQKAADKAVEKAVEKGGAEHAGTGKEMAEKVVMKSLITTLVKKAALEAAEAVPWTYDDTPGREPQVWLTGFGDSALDFELVIWLTEEAVKKPSRVKADYYWALHTALTKYGIEIPFPQRDLNFRNMGEFTLRKPEPDSEG